MTITRGRPVRGRPWLAVSVAALAGAVGGPAGIPATSVTGAEVAVPAGPGRPYAVAIGPDRTATGFSATSDVLRVVESRGRAAVVRWTPTGADDQRWEVRIAGRAVTFVNPATGTALAAAGGNARIVAVPYREADPRQWWRPDVDVDGDGYPNLRNVATGRCLGVEGGGRAGLGAPAVAWTCSAGADQEWWFYPVRSGEPLDPSAAARLTGLRSPGRAATSG